MMTWLAAILGVVVIGVVIELLTKESRMGKFIHAVYAFFVLFVIVQPLPELLGRTDWWPSSESVTINADVVADLTQTSRQAQAEQILRQMGYPNALVCVFNEVVYVNVGQNLDAAALTALQDAFGTMEVQIL